MDYLKSSLKRVNLNGLSIILEDDQHVDLLADCMQYLNRLEDLNIEHHNSYLSQASNELLISLLAGLPKNLKKITFYGNEEESTALFDDQNSITRYSSPVLWRNSQVTMRMKKIKELSIPSPPPYGYVRHNYNLLLSFANIEKLTLCADLKDIENLSGFEKLKFLEFKHHSSNRDYQELMRVEVEKSVEFFMQMRGKTIRTLQLYSQKPINYQALIASITTFCVALRSLQFQIYEPDQQDKAIQLTKANFKLLIKHLNLSKLFLDIRDRKFDKIYISKKEFVNRNYPLLDISNEDLSF